MLKGAVQAYSAKIAYGFKPFREDGKTSAEFVCSVDKDCTFHVPTSARSTKVPGVFRISNKVNLNHCCNQLDHMGTSVKADKYAVARLIAPQLNSQGSLPQGGAVMALAAEKMHMPIKRATTYRAMQLAKVEAFGN